MHPESALATRRLQPPTAIAQAQPWQTDAVTLDSPALAVMTDLTKVKAATTSPGTTLRQAEQIMIYQGVRMLFVVTEMPSLEGLITSTDLHGILAMRIIQQRNVRYDELSVADVMVRLAALDAIDHAQMQLATVRNVVATLRKQGRNHLLVVEGGTAGSPSRVRGVISRAQVERQLGTVIDMIEVAQSFADIEQMLGA
ncbi:MAG TPA: CBS domain-containing protein [Caldimonas sp.]|jgi:CBS domain-containing protein|nr:CBS domain-containing protein [Caldimonas sp.]HEX4234026.1 CBS domain-containing protein [Caldimonas sp.]